MINLLALTAIAGALGQPIPSEIQRPFQWPGPMRPLYLPGQRDGAFSFDDLKTIPFVAIVKPLGRPKHKYRQVKGVSRLIGTQKMRVVSGHGSGSTVDVVVWQPLQGVEPFGGFVPLDENANYLLLGDIPKGGSLRFARGIFVGMSSRPQSSEFFSLPAKASDVAGWALARTSASQLPASSSPEVLILKAIVEACSTKQEEENYDATQLIRWIHSERVSSGTALSNEDQVGSLNAEQFYRSYVIPSLKRAQASLPRTRREKILQVLAGWNDEESALELERLRKSPNP